VGDPYEDDIMQWSEHQAELLRRVAAGEPVNEKPDWPNIVEEIESVGNEQRHAVESLLLQALIHMLNVEAWPLSRDAPAWRADANNFRAQALNRYVPSMRQRIDLARLNRQAVRAIPETIDGLAPLPIRTERPHWTNCSPTNEAGRLRPGD
jgi:hypothetical protein